MGYRKFFINVIAVWLALFACSTAHANPLNKLLGNSEPDLLRAEQAFIPSVELEDDQTIRVDWQITNGYYLYRRQFDFKVVEPATATLGIPQYAAGETKDDKVFGLVEVYYQHTAALVPIDAAPAGPLQIEVRYQGCADIGLCYPPQKTKFTVNLAQAVPTTAAATNTPPATTSIPDIAAINAPNDDNDTDLASLLANNPLWALLVFFGLGVVLSFNPCSYPMYPILSRIIVGQGENITRWRGIRLSLTYVLPMAATYALVGALVALLGQQFNLFAALQNPWILGPICGLLVLLALSMFGLFELQLPSRWQSKVNDMSSQQQGGTYVGVAAMGALSALIVGACVLPPLTGALGFISATGNVTLGTIAMFIFGLGMGLPLLLIGGSAGWLLPKAGGWMDTIKAFFGVMLLAAVIYLLERIAPAAVTLFLWATLLIAAGVYLGAFEHGTQSWRRLGKAVGILAVLFGALQLIGLASGGRDAWQPLNHLRLGSTATTTAVHVPFQKIKTTADFNAALANTDKPVMVDFYADWCIPCKVMEKEVFSDPAVVTALADFTVLQADVTADDAADKALKTATDVFNPPSVLFFDTAKNELRVLRITGQVDAAGFLAKLAQVKSRL